MRSKIEEEKHSDCCQRKKNVGLYTKYIGCNEQNCFRIIILMDYPRTENITNIFSVDFCLSPLHSTVFAIRWNDHIRIWDEPNRKQQGLAGRHDYEWNVSLSYLHHTFSLFTHSANFRICVVVLLRPFFGNKVESMVEWMGVGWDCLRHRVFLFKYSVCVFALKTNDKNGIMMQ